MTASHDDVMLHFARLRGCVASLHTEGFIAIDVTTTRDPVLGARAAGLEQRLKMGAIGTRLKTHG